MPETDRDRVPAGPLAFGAELVDQPFHGPDASVRAADVFERRSHARGDSATHAGAG